MLSQDTKAVLSQYWLDIGAPVALALRSSIESGDYERVQKIIESFDQSKWRDPYRFRRARLAIDIIKKAEYLPMNIDRGRACIESACRAEKQCREANRQMMLYQMNHARASDILFQYVPRIRRIIRKMLGEIPDLRYVFGGFGPGATLSNTRQKSSYFEKLATNNPTITEDCTWFIPVLPRRLMTTWRSPDHWTLVQASRFEMVPKTYKTYRAICVEPLVNATVQRFFGLTIKNRLKRSGIDIDNAKDIHSRISKESSIDGKFATIDLSMASDTISYGVVKLLIPDDWFRCLDNARTKCTDFSKYYQEYHDVFEKYGISELHTNEKFSSMGNGFTFELETLIFTAICRSIDPSARSFGDDIIVSTANARQCIALLTAFGFSVNTEKSFFSGVFRESCGGDYISGVSVKGLTLKKQPSCIEDWYTLHNRIYLAAKEYHLDVERTLKRIRRCVPIWARLLIPTYMGDGGFFDDHPKGRTVNSIVQYRTYRRRPIHTHAWVGSFDADVVLAGALLGAPSSGPDWSTKKVRRVQWDPPVH